MKSCEEIYRKSANHRDLEPVPGDFLIKKTIMDIISKSVDLKGSGLGLEIGCGSGFQSALLSSFTENLVATDLPYYDARSHSLGISVANDLLTKLGAKNVKVVSCSGESLPFPDNIFDFVFSLSVLEHITDKDAAVKEMFRVVKPGGIVIMCVPTYFASLCSFPYLYLYMVKRVIQVFAGKIFRAPAKAGKTLLPEPDDALRSSGSIWESFRKSHPHFPIPAPHGTYNNIFQEFNEQLPWNWIKRVKKSGAGSVDTFGLLFLPYNILEVFSTRAIGWLYHRTRHLHYLLSRSILQYFSYSWCIVAKK